MDLGGSIFLPKILKNYDPEIIIKRLKYFSFYIWKSDFYKNLIKLSYFENH